MGNLCVSCDDRKLFYSAASKNNTGIGLESLTKYFFLGMESQMNIQVGVLYQSHLDDYTGNH